MQGEEFFQHAANGVRDFSGWDLTNAFLKKAGLGLAGSNFQQADLCGTTLRQLGLTGADFSGAKLVQASFVNVDLTGVRFEGADLQRAYIGNKSGSVLKETNFDRAHLNEATIFNFLRDVSFKETLLSGARVFIDYGTDQEREQVRNLDFTGAKLDQAQLCGNFEGCRFVDVEAQKADLGSCRLTACDFTGANLSQALLGGRGKATDLSEACFRGAYLRNVDLSGRVLRGVDFGEADLRGVSFMKSDLTGANLEGATLGSNQWLGAQLEETRFSSEGARALRMRLAGA